MSLASSVLEWLVSDGLTLVSVLLFAFIMLVSWHYIVKLVVRGVIETSVRTQNKVQMGLSSMKHHSYAYLKHSEIEMISEQNPLICNDHENNDDVMDNDDPQLPSTEESLAEAKEEERKRIELRTKTIGSVIRGLGDFFIVCIVTIQILEIFHIPIVSVLTGAAIVGLAIALALQTLLNDYFSGMFILIDNQFFTGELVSINGISGIVEEMRIRITSIRTLDGDLVTIPNGEIRTVFNANRSFSNAVIHLEIPMTNTVSEIESAFLNHCVPRMKRDPLLSKMLLSEPTFEDVTDINGSFFKVRVFAQLKPGIRYMAGRRIRRIIIEVFQQNKLEFAVIRSQLQILNAGEIGNRVTSTASMNSFADCV